MRQGINGVPLKHKRESSLNSIELTSERIA